MFVHFYITTLANLLTCTIDIDEVVLDHRSCVLTPLQPQCLQPIVVKLNKNVLKLLFNKKMLFV